MAVPCTEAGLSTASALSGKVALAVEEAPQRSQELCCFMVSGEDGQ